MLVKDQKAFYHQMIKQLYKRSNYTIYLLEDDRITDIYEYTYDEGSRSFEGLKENHYQVIYNDDTVSYRTDDRCEEFVDGKIIRSYGKYADGTNYDASFEYADNYLKRFTINDDLGITTTEITRHSNKIPSKIEVYVGSNEDQGSVSSRVIRSIFEYDEEGRMIADKEYFDGELSSTRSFGYSDGRLVSEKYTSANDEEMALSDFDRQYAYNDHGYIERVDDLLDPDHYEKYEYNDDYTKMTIYTLLKNTEASDAPSVIDTQEFSIYHQ